MNRVNLIGNVGVDPEIKTISNGKRMAKFSLATSKKWKDKTSGEVKAKTTWHRVVVFSEKLVKFIDAYVQKGTKLHVEGTLKSRTWKDKDGLAHLSSEVLLEDFDSNLKIST